MQTQPTSTGARGRESFETILKRCYARNHQSLEDFPVFREQFIKTKLYLKEHPEAVEQRVYYAHLSAEIGAAPFVVEQVVGLSLLPEPLSPFMLYSLKVALKKVSREDVIARYEPFQNEEVKKIEQSSGLSEVVVDMSKPLPKKYWWSRQMYAPKVVQSRAATFGEIEFLTAQLGEQTR